MALALELHVGAMQGDDLLDGHILLRDEGAPGLDLGREHRCDAAVGERLERLVDGGDEVMA